MAVAGRRIFTWNSELTRSVLKIATHCYFLFIYFYLIQYLSRGIQFSRASLNGSLLTRDSISLRLINYFFDVLFRLLLPTIILSFL